MLQNSRFQENDPWVESQGMFIKKSLVGDDLIEAKVTLVVPEKLHDKFPESVRPHLVTLESFISDVRLLTV